MKQNKKIAYSSLNLFMRKSMTRYILILLYTYQRFLQLLIWMNNFLKALRIKILTLNRIANDDKIEIL